MGTALPEMDVKAGLLEMCPDLHFDMGVCLNIWHPYQSTRQNVFYKGNSVGAMDRGVLPELTVWSMKKDVVRIPVGEVKAGELALYETSGVLGGCQKCLQTWQAQHRPYGLIGCPNGCGNMGYSHDTERFLWKDIPSQYAQVFRKVKDRVLLVGWRWTFSRLMRKGVPGVTKEKLEARFRVNLDPRIVDEFEVDADIEPSFLDSQVKLATA
jgi:hypothetical protein